MTQLDPEAERLRIIRGRNRVFGVLLIGFAVLIFAISIAKMKLIAVADISRTDTSKNRKVAFIVACVALAMLGLGYAAVPLYRMFCQTTGFGGTTMRVSEVQAATVKPTTTDIRVRFDANVERGMPWDFKPVQAVDTVAIGVRDMAIFTARNLSDKPITGTASFNVEPEQAAAYFNKIQCFCFTEQTLKPGEEVRMPVIYYVDPKILNDPDNKDVHEITLSYTFHVTKDATATTSAETGAKALDRAGTGG